MPATSTRPLVGGKNPARVRMIVVLPEPFGPSRPIASPASAWNDTPRTASVRPKTLVRSATAIIAGEHAAGRPGAQLRCSDSSQREVPVWRQMV
jgi:hypothetical protein